MSGPPENYAEYARAREAREAAREASPRRSTLFFTPNICISSSHPPPNAWWRFWQWALLGWKWVRL